MLRIEYLSVTIILEKIRRRITCLFWKAVLSVGFFGGSQGRRSSVERPICMRNYKRRANERMKVSAETQNAADTFVSAFDGASRQSPCSRREVWRRCGYQHLRSWVALLFRARHAPSQLSVRGPFFNGGRGLRSKIKFYRVVLSLLRSVWMQAPGLM